MPPALKVSEERHVVPWVFPALVVVQQRRGAAVVFHLLALHFDANTAGIKSGTLGL